MASLDELDKKLWKKLKKDAGIKKAKWFKKADASVGKYIESMSKAKAKFESTKVTADLLSYMSALEDLEKVFGKFLDKKGLDAEIDDSDMKKGEKEKLISEIDNWKKEISGETDGLKKKIAKINKSTGGDMKKIDALDAKNKKAFWDKSGISDTFNI